MPSSCYNHYATLPLFYFLFESSSSPIANSPSPVDSASSLFLDLVHFSPVLVIDSVQASSSLLDFTLPAQRSPSSRSVPLGTFDHFIPLLNIVHWFSISHKGSSGPGPYFPKLHTSSSAPDLFHKLTLLFGKHAFLPHFSSF